MTVGMYSAISRLPIVVTGGDDLPPLSGSGHLRRLDGYSADRACA
jgi:hypothetical protein